MRVLLTGASGFIGRHIAAHLLAAGHEVVGAVREPARFLRRFPGCRAIAVDFARDTQSGAWRPRLAGIDAVVNCVGVLQADPARMRAVHVDTPLALFTACGDQGVRRIVHLSAISADTEAGTEFAATKRDGEQALMALDLDWHVLRPSLVYAEGTYGGTSLLRGLAALPGLVPLIGAGDQLFRPIHARDLAETVLRCLDGRIGARSVLSPCGPDALSLRQLLAMLRAWLDLPPARFVRLPRWLVGLAARAGDWLGLGPINSTALKQLDYGNAQGGEGFAAAAGFSPRSFARALAASPSHVQDRWHARLYFAKPISRLVLAATWLGSGLLGLAAARSVTLSMLGLLGLHGDWAMAALWGSCLLDLAIGAALLLGVFSRFIGAIQLAVVVAYTALISIAWPGVWLDPLGPIVKNMAVAALIYVSWAMEQER